MTESQVGDLIAERYRLRERVPSDVEHAERWAAEDEILGREVLVALVSGPGAAVALDEARRAALVTDTRLARILDVGQVPDSPYVVTERPRGRSLADLVDAHGPLSGAEARAVVGEVAEALAAAERRGVHHTALRPSVVHLVGGKVLVEGLGLDGALSDGGLRGSRASVPAVVAGLGRLLQFALTGQRVGDVPVPSGALDQPSDGDVEAVALASVAASLLTTLTPAPGTPSGVVDELAPWGEVPDRASADGKPAVEAATAPGEPRDESAPHDDLPHDDLPHDDGEGGAPDVSADDADVPADAGGAVPSADADAQAVADAPADHGSENASDGAPSAQEDAAQKAPGSASPARTSVRAMLAGSPAAPTIPGTPQPPPSASPVKRSSVLGGGIATGAAAAAGAGAVVAAAPVAAAPVVPPTAVPAPPAPSAPGSDSAEPMSVTPAWDKVAGTSGRPVSTAAPRPRPVTTPAGSVLGGRGEDVDLRTLRFDPTVFTLVLALVLALGGTVWAASNLSGFRSPFQWGSNARPVPTDSSGEPQATATTTTAPPVLPVIADVQQLDPDGDENEHPEAASRATDLDPTTYWFSRTYRSATFAGMGKRGIGIAVSLEKPAPVATVYIQSNSTGGNVQVRATDPKKPDEGTVLYEGPVDKDMEIVVPTPVQAEHVVLWFTELPQTSGQNRVEIREISVS